MTSDIYMILVIFGIVLSALINVLFDTYGYKAKLEQFESFTNYSEDIKTVVETSAIKFKDVVDDRPLIKYAKLKSNTVIDDISEFAYMTSYDFFSVSPNDIFQRIVHDLAETNMKIRSEYIEDPVYVIIYRAPVSSDYNENGSIIGGHKSLTQLYVIYPQYWKKTSNDKEEVTEVTETARISKQKNEEGIKSLEKYFNNNISSDSDKNGCTVYKVNKKNKMFFNIS